MKINQIICSAKGEDKAKQLTDLTGSWIGLLVISDHVFFLMLVKLVSMLKYNCFNSGKQKNSNQKPYL